MHGHYWGWGSWIIGLAFLILFVLLIVRLTVNSSGRSTRNTPLDILKEKYAKGEIKREEYLEKKEDLKRD